MTPPGSVNLISQNGRIISHPKPTDDYDDPLNWSRRRKALHLGTILIYVAVTFAWVDLSLLRNPNLAAELSMDASQLAVSTSFRYIGMAFAAIVFIPLGYKYGRRPVYIASLLLQLAAAAWTARVQQAWEYRAANALAGAGAVVAQALVPMTIADLFFTHQLATAYGLAVFAQGLGSFVGPILAAEVEDRHGHEWRWMPTSMAAAFGATAVLVLLGAEESTFVPNIDNQVAAKTREEEEARVQSTFYNRRVSYGGDSEPGTPAVDEHNMHDLVNVARRAGGGVTLDLPPGPRPLRQRFAFVTPTGRPIRRRFLSAFVILGTFPGVVYAALTYGFLMAWLSLFSQVLQTQMTKAPYNLDRRGLALLDLGPLLGHFLGTLVVPPLSDYWVIARARRSGGMYEPEMRLWFALFGGAFVAAGILMFGIGIGDMIGDAMVGIVFFRNVLAIILWIGIMPQLAATRLNCVFVFTSVAASVVLLIPIPLLIWGRRGRILTASKYREYSLEATPPATLKKIMVER
ncbi:Major facilitator superfamily transporter [Cordyceps fumosorosea ARSEF 2679]|uniref:Major facilitator superfamily transporter n=1 Tax=Cordyceps fumosorosea (strain ARSEF 2679) TaxID=1081104 RepID=A0A167SWW6_CORFA|nr:Major facilitator superfamily transporter [Cordyceps fumosorosea ARSEF 2679]OAA60012.1 Major facilitator superfamily transporter [Cordyceps fumosorosea ARSEF 2679]